MAILGFSSLLKAHKLYKNLHGSYPTPWKVIHNKNQPPASNPKCDKWFDRKQALITLLNTTLSSNAFA